ncbi:hypothetical protein D3C73_1477370 [compost metagenome]
MDFGDNKPYYPVEGKEPAWDDYHLIGNAPEYITYLLALLEEKDKALAFYADEDNYTIGNYMRIENDMVYDWESKVQQDFGTKAKAALTSSNNEGE